MSVADWEKKFTNWTGPSSDDEATKCENADNAITKAIKASPALANRNISIRPHGSYRNNTNVRQNSDVDIYVCCYDTFYYDFSLIKGYTPQDAGITSATYDYWQFRNEVHEALTEHFGVGGVTPGNKAFDVHANTYRVDADVLPCFEYRLYTNRNTYGQFSYISGIQSYSTKLEEIINWPEQNYNNGVSKNNTTKRFYKFVARIIKRLRYEMSDNNISEASAIPSYLVECLVYNVPNQGFGHATYTADVRYVLAHLYNATMPGGDCQEWTEINRVKYLFYESQPWTREQAFAFIKSAWDYIGFE